jgi:hypothetical protein
MMDSKPAGSEGWQVDAIERQFIDCAKSLRGTCGRALGGLEISPCSLIGHLTCLFMEAKD